MLGNCLVYLAKIKMEAYMQYSMRTCSFRPVVTPAVALLPVSWQNLGSVMLGWIHHRTQLPGIAENAQRSGLVQFGVSRGNRRPQHHSGHDLERRYEAWRTATNADQRRSALGELAHAFSPLIRATVR